jgi:hypothetical protein
LCNATQRTRTIRRKALEPESKQSNDIHWESTTKHSYSCNNKEEQFASD